jgi:hypothetical protein
MGEDSIGHPVQPGEGLVSGWDRTRLAPGGEEGVGYRVLHHFGCGATTAVGVDMGMEAVIRIEESGVCAAHLNL